MFKKRIINLMIVLLCILLGACGNSTINSDNIQQSIEQSTEQGIKIEDSTLQEEIDTAVNNTEENDTEERKWEPI